MRAPTADDLIAEARSVDLCPALNISPEAAQLVREVCARNDAEPNRMARVRARRLLEVLDKHHGVRWTRGTLSRFCQIKLGRQSYADR